MKRLPQSARLLPRCSLAALVLLFASQTAPSSLAQKTTEAPGEANAGAAGPVYRIPVGPLGYRPPSSFYLTARLADTTVDFLDETHLLFTFRDHRLLSREPGQRDNDDDQVIHAMVLDLPDGKVSADTRWRLHDQSRYLWMLTNAQFLLRRENAFQMLGRDLVPKPFWKAPGEVLDARITPDRRTALVQYRTGTDKSKLDAKLAIVRIADKKILATADMSRPVEMAILSTGFVEAQSEPENRWDIRFVSFTGTRTVVTTIKSTCTPTEQFLSTDVLLLTSCPREKDDPLVEAVDLAGKRLWQQTWPRTNMWSTFSNAETAERVAWSNLVLKQLPPGEDRILPEYISKQLVRVLDIAHGTILETVSASPILSSGHNYALSPDARQFAVLRNGVLELYALPASPTARQAPR
jgi:hypothetical protein